MYLGDYKENSVFGFTFTTVSGDGSPSTLGGTPAIDIYKNNDVTPTNAGVTLTVDFDSFTGLNHVRVDTSDNFYDITGDYHAVITTGTAGGINIRGYSVATFSIENRFDETVLADTGTHGGSSTIISLGTPISSNMEQVDGSGEAAAKLARSAGTMVSGSVSPTGLTPTTTQFRTKDISEATADHYNGRVIIWLDGALKDSAVKISDYSLQGGEGDFTVAKFDDGEMTEAPSSGNSFLII